MTVWMWISKWQNEMELLATGLQLVFYLLLTIGVFAMVHQQKKANRSRRRVELYLKKTMDKPVEKAEPSGEAPQIPDIKTHADEEENRIISTVLQEIFP